MELTCAYSRADEFVRPQVGRVVHLAIADISRAPAAHRPVYSSAELLELIRSVAENGLPEPLRVRAYGGGYQLLDGEERLRAAYIAGFTHVPCLICGFDAPPHEPDSAELLTSLTRGGLDCFAQAAVIQRLITEFGLSLRSVAEYAGLTRAEVTDKLRLLRFDALAVAQMRAHGMGQAHAMPLLRLPSGAPLRLAVAEIAEQRLTAAETAAYVDRLLGSSPPVPTIRRSLIRDLRIFLNTVKNSAEVMRAGGTDVSVRQTEDDEAVTLTVTVRKPSAAR